ncbi:MAG: FkbM family methyltransferase [Acidimicrobiia bacterium]|nr:FkbM family methyltransferase [Acidimicrobiia bacterium]
MSALEDGAKRVIRRLAPRWYWGRYLEGARHEPELALVPLLADRARTSVDVGASGGLYLSRLVGSSQRCVAFEPRAPAAADLRAMVAALDLEVQVEEVALSDRSGTATMRVLSRDRGRSTIEAANPMYDPDGSALISYEVETRRLDDYGLGDVGFVKIDVEGHELAVLRGALATIAGQRPRLLVEVEERHRAGATIEVFDLLAGLAYHGCFVLDGALVPVDKFDPDLHQDPANVAGWKDRWRRSGTYVNNFLFLPEPPSPGFLASAEAALSA